MKIVFLNPPHSLSISRRYRCSYYSPKYLLPPHDLLQLATCAREWNGAEVAVVDAIALQCTEALTHDIISQAAPDMVVAETGIDIFGDDMACLDRLKNAFPDVKFGIFGYYPTGFTEEVLQKSSMDFVLRREPEKPLSGYIAALEQGLAADTVMGVAGRRADGSIFINAEERIQDLDQMPFSDYGLVDLDHYEEAFFGKRCGAILAARGCPFACTYCAPTYGHTMIIKSSERVVAEMAHLIEAGAQSIRFLDDTFTCNRQWTIETCKRIIDRGIQIPWSCLSRVDTIDQELLDWMRRAGCERINVGIESYAPRVLERLNKKVDPKTINQQLALIRKSGIQIVGHFIVGAPFETDADFEETVRGVLKAPVDFIIANILKPFAGTRYFEEVSDLIEFNLLPYKCAYKDPSIAKVAKQRYNRLYLKFYLRPVVLWRQFHYFVRNPARAIQMLVMFLK